MFGLLFLIFDLEVILLYPLSVSGFLNGIYGVGIGIIFAIIVTIGFVFELGKNALTIESKQDKYTLLKSTIKVNVNVQDLGIK